MVWYFFIILFIANANAPTEVDSSISQVVKDANKISITKNIFGNNKVETSIAAEKTSFKRNTTNVWKEFGYIKQQPCNFGVDKENLPGNSITYFNQGYQSYKDNKKVYYGDYFLVDQINDLKIFLKIFKIMSLGREK